MWRPSSIWSFALWQTENAEYQNWDIEELFVNLQSLFSVLRFWYIKLSNNQKLDSFIIIAFI